MSTLMINDLSMGKELDRAALANLTGRGEWHRISRSVSTGAWGSYSRLSKQYVGTKMHDGYLSRQYRERWLRKRTQYEYTSWNHYVRV
jgi:hypothetical protein